MKYSSEQFFEFENPNFANTTTLVLTNPINSVNFLSSGLQSFTFPGLSVSPIELPVGLQNHLAISDNVVTVDDISMTLLVSNSFVNYFVFRKWLIKSANSPLESLADASVIFVDNNNKAKVLTTFPNVFPTLVSPITIDHTGQEAIQKTFDVTFKTNGEIETVLDQSDTNLQFF